MKKNTIFLFLMFSCYCLFCQTFYKNGDTLNVWAIDGLNLREAPEINSNRIIKINYGKQVVVIDNEIGKIKFKSDVCSTYNFERHCHEINGHWVKVKIGNLTGFVFDFYISRLPVLNWVREWRAMKPEGRIISESFIYYGINSIGLISTLENLEPDSFYNKEIKFNNGISYFFEPYFPDKDGAQIIKLKGYSFNEGYLLANVLYRIEEIPGIKKSDYFYEFPEAGTKVTIKKLDDLVTITYHYHD